MMMGPEPMMRIDLRSVRRGIPSQGRESAEMEKSELAGRLGFVKKD